MIDASVVDLPEPVGPVTSTRPRGFFVRSCRLGGRPELLERLDVRRDRAERGREALPLVERVDAEAGEAADAVREVELAAQLQVLLLLGRRDPVDQLPDQIRVEHRELVEELDVPPAANRGCDAGRQVQVGGAERDRLLEQGVDGQRGGGCVLRKLHGCSYRHGRLEA